MTVTFKTKSDYIDAIQYTGDNDAEVIALTEARYFDDAANWYDGTWNSGEKVLWFGSSWNVLEVGSWIILKDNEIYSIMSNDQFALRYEPV